MGSSLTFLAWRSPAPTYSTTRTTSRPSKDRLKRFQGEIKGILTRGSLVAGIGNAYADEVLFEAELSPFRKRAELSADEAERLHSAVYSVPAAAVDELRSRMGEGIHLKPRDFLKVHNKGNQPCPRCGGPHQSDHSPAAHHELLPSMPAWAPDQELSVCLTLSRAVTTVASMDRADEPRG